MVTHRPLLGTPGRAVGRGRLSIWLSKRCDHSSGTAHVVPLHRKDCVRGIVPIDLFEALPMSIAKFLARELGNPSTIMGRLYLAPMWNRRNAALNNTAFEHLELQSHDRVLEIGFGGGYLNVPMLHPPIKFE